MITLKKSDLEAVLLTISAYSPPKEGEQQKMVSGLLTENLSLGTKRKLQKIHKAVNEAYKEFIEDVKELQKACKLEGSTDEKPLFDKEKLNKEIDELLQEEVKLEVDQVQLSQIEGISTNNNYDFDIIEKIAV